MCIDDDPIALMVIEICLKRAKFAECIIKKESAQEALNYFETIENPDQIPSLVFLDLNMPVINGWGYIDKFIELYPQYANDSSIIILSSSVDPSDKLKASENPFVKMFIPKPISVNTLLDI